MKSSTEATISRSPISATSTSNIRPQTHRQARSPSRSFGPPNSYISNPRAEHREGRVPGSGRVFEAERCQHRLIPEEHRWAMGLLGHPAELAREAARDGRPVVSAGDRAAAADVDVIREAQRNRHRREAPLRQAARTRRPPRGSRGRPRPRGCAGGVGCTQCSQVSTPLRLQSEFAPQPNNPSAPADGSQPERYLITISGSMPLGGAVGGREAPSADTSEFTHFEKGWDATDLPMPIRPIFVFSISRSGSSLVQRVIGAHDGVSTVSEPWLLLPQLFAFRPQGVQAEYVHPLLVSALEEFCEHLPNGRDDYRQELHDFVLRLYGKAADPTATHFLDKTPPYCLISEEIMQLFPEGRFVFLWRNPLSVIASTIQDR